MSNSVEVVLEELERAGFEQLSKPLVVAGVAFDFDAAVTGTGVSHDLVVIVGQDADPLHLIRLLSGLTRSLDRLESKRPLSVVLIGSRPGNATLSRLQESARVILIKSRHPKPNEVQNALSVLLPLTLPATMQTTIDPLGELTRCLGDDASDEHRALMDTARAGPDAVCDAFQNFLEEALPSEDGTLPSEMFGGAFE